MPRFHVGISRMKPGRRQLAAARAEGPGPRQSPAAGEASGVIQATGAIQEA